MHKESLFRAFLTSQCFSLPCQAFNGRRKVSSLQHCQLCDFIMSQCLLFCLKPQLLETMDYARILALIWKTKKISSPFGVRKLVETWPQLYPKKSKTIFGIDYVFMCVFWSQQSYFSFGGGHLTHDFWMLGEWCFYIGDTTGVWSNSVEWFLT